MNIKFHDNKTVLDFKTLPENCVYPLMCHGSDVLVVKSKEHANSIPIRTHKADAVITTSDDVLIVMPTADCAPIVLQDNNKKILAMMHCGWKPALRGLIENTIDKMVSLGSDINDISAVIGPCIEMKSFECREDMRSKFLEQNKDNDIFFIRKTPETWGFDLRLYCQVKLHSLGINYVDFMNIDTFSHPDYHSYRKYCHLHGAGFNIAQQDGAFMNLNMASF